MVFNSAFYGKFYENWIRNDFMGWELKILFNMKFIGRGETFEYLL